MTARQALIVGLLLAAAAPALLASAFAQPDSDGITSGVYAGLRGSYAANGNHVTTWATLLP